MHYVLTVDVPGYLPAGDPVEFESWEEASMALRDELIYGADQLADVYGEFHEIVGLWLGAADDVGTGSVASVQLPASESPHDLGVVFEISPLGL